ncbi:epithelial-stromal interaction protein 1 [Pungitius pungitius]|uniref:epithelial-stromal interaction protein 1 n=1 Tax=Pungitius pungitius TaxID=134920 RepID=UPI002E1554BD
MDPYRRDTGRKPHPVDPADGASGPSGGELPPGSPNGDAPEGGTPAATGTQPQHSGGFTVIPPNESTRDKLRRIAQKEEEDLQRWKEANRVTYVHADPEKLGGAATLAATREMQHADLRFSTVQKRLKKQELDRRRRQEEEAENQRRKDIQREKAERLEERKRQEEQRRREQHGPDHARATERFLQRFERTTVPCPPASAARTSRKAAVEIKPGGAEARGERDVQQEHRRVNQAFLDGLEGRRRATGERPPPGPEGFGQRAPPAAPPDSDHVVADWTDEAGPGRDPALVKLVKSFPGCSASVLKEFLQSCNGDYQQAHDLLDSAMD